MGKGARERVDLRGPALLMASRLEVKVEQPGPPIWSLESPAQRPIEIGQFRRDLFLGEGAGGERTYVRGLGKVGKKPAQGQQGPPTVHAAVPIEASEEDRMQDARRCEV